jgi:class 3 adenylate cyclase/Flp pilus assembly protein TadD
VAQPPNAANRSAELAQSKRRLAIVLAADAVGFSRRMGIDEHATVATLLECRELVSQAVQAFGGRIVGTPGDFLLALMPTGRQAVEGALEIQARLAERNAAVEQPHRAEFRIGIGMGDIYEHGGDVLGDAVNVAARLQAIAPPEGIVVSGGVRDLIGPDESFAFEYLGDQALKNLVAPVRVYAVVPLREPVHPRSGHGAPATAQRSRVVDRLPVKPVVEIEPFKAIGGSAEERLFASALVEELLTMLARLSNSLLVREVEAAQTSTSSPEAAKTQRLYCLAGSVRRTAEHLRINARLSVRGGGEAIWVDRFEYRASQLLDVQERIAREVVTAIQVTLTEGEQARLWARATTNVRAWELFQHGHDLEQRFSRYSHREARSCYQAALEQDPGYISALIALAFCHLDEIRLGWTEGVERAFAEAQSLYNRAKAINPDDPECYALQAYLELHQRNDERAVAAMETAARLAPQSSEMTAYLGSIYHTVGRYEDAIVAYRRSMWMNSHYPAWIATNLGFALCIAGLLHEARKTFLGVVSHHPDYMRAHLGLAITYRRLGFMADALEAAAEVRRLDPLFTAAQWAQDRPYADLAVVDAFVADMRSVGLP